MEGKYLLLEAAEHAMPEIKHRGKISFCFLTGEEKFLRRLKTILRLGCCCFSSVADVEALAESHQQDQMFQSCTSFAMGNNENWALQTKGDLADLIYLLGRCDSYHYKISLPGAQTSKTGAREGAANGVSQVPSHLVFSSPMSSLVALTLWETSGNPSIFQRYCFLGVLLVWCVTLPFYRPVYKSSHRTDFKAQCSEKLWAQSSALGVMRNITVLSGWPGSLFMDFSYQSILCEKCRERCLQVWLRHLL